MLPAKETTPVRAGSNEVHTTYATCGVAFVDQGAAEAL